MDTTFIMAFVVPIVLGTVILAVGGALLFWNSRRGKRKGKVETEGWLTTGGKVLAAHLEEHDSRSGDRPEASAVKTYEPMVEYVYTVDGTEYHSSKVFPGGDSNFDQAEAQSIIEKYPLNSYAPVRYDPQNPSASSLEEHPPHTTHYLLVAAQSLIVLGIGVCCFTFFMMFILVGRFQ